MAYKYALPGPPFNFLGHMSETQKNAFYKWLDKRTALQPKVKEWYQIRSHQLRKTAGLLEEYYNTQNPDPDAVEPLATTFKKEEWKEGKDGHWAHHNRPDFKPAVTVGRIKDRFRHMLQRDDEGVFWMNWLRNHIERHEDNANQGAEAGSTVAKLRGELDTMFNLPEYEEVLLKDVSQTYKGEPLSRVNPFDEPTIKEKELLSHDTTGAVNLKTPIPT